MSKLRITKPAQTVELDIHVHMTMSDGRNPQDGFEPGRPRSLDGKQEAVPEKMGSPQPWITVVIVGEEACSWPVAEFAVPATGLYKAAIDRALVERGLSVAN